MAEAVVSLLRLFRAVAVKDHKNQQPVQPSPWRALASLPGVLPHGLMLMPQGSPFYASLMARRHASQATHATRVTMIHEPPQVFCPLWQGHFIGRYDARRPWVPASLWLPTVKEWWAPSVHCSGGLPAPCKTMLGTNGVLICPVELGQLSKERGQEHAVVRLHPCLWVSRYNA